MKTYKVWLTPKKYTLVSALCPSEALKQIGHRVWKIEMSKNNNRKPKKHTDKYV